ncbi:hypothetical protein [Psychroserpens algicola]|uniref:hypothetical protein n=1 Tax=Psychroserpens algicola TaxID=1719034 RepID=UPI001954590E|nr:hypothetical protein [Psychroserpens algicola]
MKTNYLISNKYKVPGWILLMIGLVVGVFLAFSDYESNIFQVKVISIFGGESTINNSFNDSPNTIFSIIENSIIDELAALSIIIGGLLVGFSEEKVEDEFIYKLRKDSLVWAIIFNYIVLMLAIIFVYNFAFFDVLVYNIFTPLLFFIIRFNFLKSRA